MKLFKLNILSIIAILTLAITLAANAGRFKHGRITPDEFVDCYTTVTYRDPSLGCNAFNLIVNQSFCPDGSIVGKPTSLFINPVDPAEDCSPTGSKFCCAKTNTITAAKCGLFNEIIQVYCKLPQ